jgi:beta-phosphoglucomutase
MNTPHQSASRRTSGELWAAYERSADGILIAEIENRRLVHGNPTICRMLGYDDKELLSLTVDDIHPPADLPRVLEVFEAMCQQGLEYARNIPCLRKDGVVFYTDVAAACVTYHNRLCAVGFFHDVTEQMQAIEALRASEERYRLIADNVADVIWTVKFSAATVQRAMTQQSVVPAVDALLDQWRFSFVSPAAERLFKFSLEEIAALSLRDIMAPESFAAAREAMIEEFKENVTGAKGPTERHALELEFLAKGGGPIWCEVVSTYFRDDRGMPTGMLGITRDVTRRRESERASRESEAKLRSLFENLPDLVLLVDQAGGILFLNREQPQYNGKSLVGQCGFDLIAPEHRAAVQRGLSQAISIGLPQALEIQDAVGAWWSCRFVPLGAENGKTGARLAMAICTDVTQQRRAVEAIKKEQQLLRRLLDLQERERQLIAYEIHDGFAQQLAGALFRLQGFRHALARDPDEAWKAFDFSAQLLSRAIDETRRLITGLRPPILDEMGVLDAVEYLIYEHRKQGGPEIEFDRDATGERLPPPLENAVFRIVQESLNNACRHSRSDRIHVSIVRRDGRILIDVRDWGVGFDPGTVEEHRFGLQGIRERARLLEGSVVIESAPGKGTHVAVELPLAGVEGAQAVIFDMDGVLIDTYQAHYQSWVELAEAEGLHITESEFASTFGRTSREIIASLWGSNRCDDAQIAELDRRKEAAFRRIIEDNFPAMPGVGNLLRSLHEAGIRMALGSSGPPENVALALDRLGARDLFAAVVTCEDVTRGKPDPEVFLIAAERLGVAPARCAVVEDAPAGVAAANAAGMTSIGLSSTGRTPEDLTAAHLVVRSLAELSPKIVSDLIARRQSTTVSSD